MISIISVVNNKKRAEECLLSSLRRLDSEYEFVLIDNTEHRFKNAAEAFNKTALKTKGEYFAFIHQDLCFHDVHWLRDVEDNLSTISDLGVAGLAGMKKPAYVNQLEIWLRYLLLIRIGDYQTWFSTYGRGNLLEGKDAHPWAGKRIVEPVAVQTVDEVMLIVPAKVFKTNKFDEKTCDSWHLYGVDLSLTLAKKGLKTYVLPPEAIHYSSGKIDQSYIRTLINLLEKHASEKLINTTCGLYPTRKELIPFFWGLPTAGLAGIGKKADRLVLTSLEMLLTF